MYNVGVENNTVKLQTYTAANSCVPTTYTTSSSSSLVRNIVNKPCLIEDDIIYTNPIGIGVQVSTTKDFKMGFEHYGPFGFSEWGTGVSESFSTGHDSCFNVSTPAGGNILDSTVGFVQGNGKFGIGGFVGISKVGLIFTHNEKGAFTLSVDDMGRVTARKTTNLTDNTYVYSQATISIPAVAFVGVCFVGLVSSVFSYCNGGGTKTEYKFVGMNK